MASLLTLSSTRLGERVEEIFSIRTQHEQISRLLPPDQQTMLGVPEAIAKFSGVRALQCNAYTDSSWRTQVSMYEREMLAAESKAAEKLRAHLQVTGSSPHQLLREFQRFDRRAKPAIAVLALTLTCAHQVQSPRLSTSRVERTGL